MCAVTDSYSAQHLKANKYQSWKKASSKTDYSDKATLGSAYWLISVKRRDSLANLLKFGEDL